jgi:hypothetical protein
MNIPCQMRTLENKHRFELLVEANPGHDEPIPAEVFMLCLLLSALKYADDHGMDIDRALKDSKTYHSAERMGTSMNGVIN